jgi:hypothetical protein
MTESPELFLQSFPMPFFLASADTRSQGTGVIDHARRFPPPWSVEDIGAAFVVKDDADQMMFAAA